MQNKELPYKNRGDLTQGPIGKHLVRLTIPMIWGILSIILVQIADTYFIGLLGTHELASISFTFPVTMLLSHLLFGLNIAMSSVISRLIGAKKMDDARRVILHGLILAFTASLVISTLCHAFLVPIFTMLGADEKTMPDILAYMPFWLVGFVFLAIPVNGNSALRAAGDAFHPALIMISIAVVNVILDPVFIFGYFGVPAMGVRGAAFATFLAYMVAVFISLYFLVIKKKLISLDGLHLDKFGDSAKRLAVIAIPAGITNTIQPATNAFIVALLAAYGPEAVAAFGVVSRIEAFALLLIISLALGMVPIIGQNWGARNFERVNHTINLAIGFNMVWSLSAALVMGLFARQIAGIFTEDTQVIDTAALFFWIVPFSYAFGNLVFGWSSAFNAIGRPKRSFVMIVTKAIIMTVPAVYIGDRFFGITGIFVAIAMANLIAGTIFHIISWRVCLKTEGEAELALS